MPFSPPSASAVTEPAWKKWHQHLATLHNRVEKLNALNFRSLHYTNSLGTDLTVELPEGHIWEAGNDVTLSGQEYVANMPTEELYTSPLKTGVNGVVYASMPLVHDGSIIDGFHFVVRDGKDRGGPCPKGRGDPAGRHLRG